MICTGCGNEKAYKTISGKGWEFCDRCANLSFGSAPDVYWDGKPEEGLPDDPKTGKPMVFGSKGEKAAYLKANGLIEAGDRVRGGHATIFRGSENPGEARDAAMRALNEVQNMGADRRKQEFRRILMEAQNAR